jgi:hypothetical protein
VYNTWADKKGLNGRQRLPATAEILLAFVAACTGVYSGNTISGAISAIKAWHAVHLMPWWGDDLAIARLCKGANHLAPPSSKRAKRKPYTTEMLDKVLETLDTSIPLDAAVAAAITTAFWGVARLGELVTKGTKDGRFSQAAYPTPASVRWDVADRDGNVVSRSTVLIITPFHTAAR